jgi:hypothetical protein
MFVWFFCDPVLAHPETDGDNEPRCGKETPHWIAFGILSPKKKHPFLSPAQDEPILRHMPEVQ